jgi:DNA-binding protein H-NS
MISNLESARALVAADLEHARSVLDLWSRQVSELEKTLEQMDAVGESRIALRDEHTGVKAVGAPLLTAEKPVKPSGKTGRKPKAASAAPAAEASTKKERTAKKKGKDGAEKPARSNGAKSSRAGKAQKAGADGKGAAPAEAKYKDPNSDKTWRGFGRRPSWLIGDPQQYAIQPDNGAPAAAQADTAS